MGIFDRVIKSGVNKLKNSAVNALGDALGDAVRGAINGDDSCNTEQRPQHSSCNPASDTPGKPEEPRKDRAFFAGVLASEFGGAYEIRENISPAELGGSGRNYDFGLYRAGRLIGVVVLIEHNRDRSAAFINAKRACANANVPFISFYYHMPNERGYVIARIKSFL